MIYVDMATRPKDILVTVCLIAALIRQGSEANDSAAAVDSEWSPQPTVMVAVLVRNKAHTLPWFLYYLENLDYPKQRMRLWIRSDHNEDESSAIVSEWLRHVEHEYSHVDYQDDSSEITFSDAHGPFDWSAKHFQHIIRLRQQALETARRASAEFLLFVDADNLLLNNQVLKELVSQNKLVIGPMFNTTVSDSYSNFWCGMDSNGYYERTDDYVPIQQRHREGVFPVPMVHSTLLIQLRDPSSRLLAYDPPPPGYRGPIDDIIVFAHSVKYNGLTMHIDNRAFYGYMLVPLEAHNTLDEEKEQFIHVKLENLVQDRPLQRLPYVNIKYPTPSKLGFDQIYMINLERRPDRREKMLESFLELGISAKIFNAVDGKALNDSYLLKAGINFLPGFADPFKGRPMTMGEIGCFLSHYYIWDDILANGYQKVIVFEDDIRFQPFFTSKLRFTMNEAKMAGINWDLIYIGRKRLRHSDEYWVEGTTTLVWPHYSYWTLGYLLSYTGAWKLIQQNPLRKMIPVDEYLPIMFDRHPEDRWRLQFEPRNLLALSAHPLLLEPTHYTGQPGYITDTEDSPVINDVTVQKFKGDPGDEILVYDQGAMTPNSEL